MNASASFPLYPRDFPGARPYSSHQVNWVPFLVDANGYDMYACYRWSGNTVDEARVHTPNMALAFDTREACAAFCASFKVPHFEPKCVVPKVIMEFAHDEE